MKKCRKCDTTKSLFEFYKNNATADKLTLYCKECCKKDEKDYHKRNPTKKINRNRKKMITASGAPITSDELRLMIIEQDNKCDICNTIMKKPCIDHDHSTGLIRGLLCQQCNSMLGMAKDDIQRLENAIIYLKKHYQTKLFL